jgi:hypothetical protein
MMTSEVKDNQEFARWFGKWTARIQKRRTPVDKTASAEEQKHPPGTDARAVANEQGLSETYSKAETPAI